MFPAPDGHALGLEVVPPLVHLLQPLLQRGRVLSARPRPLRARPRRRPASPSCGPALEAAEELPAGGRQGEERVALGVDLALEVLE